MLDFLSVKLIEREHPARINYAILRVNFAVAPFWASSSTRLFARCRHTVKIRTLQLNWDNPLCEDFNFLIKRLKKSWTRLNMNEHELDCLPDCREAILSARHQPWPRCFEYAHVWFSWAKVVIFLAKFNSKGVDKISLLSNARIFSTWAAPKSIHRLLKKWQKRMFNLNSMFYWGGGNGGMSSIISTKRSVFGRL